MSLSHDFPSAALREFTNVCPVNLLAMGIHQPTVWGAIAKHSLPDLLPASLNRKRTVGFILIQDYFSALLEELVFTGKSPIQGAALKPSPGFNLIL